MQDFFFQEFEREKINQRGHPASSSSSSTLGDQLPACLPPTPVEVVEKEHMFDKVVTPSDVGKLNRLVIPKQHAEKYFPLGDNNGNNNNNVNGLLLTFEDRNCKLWRFRYSYWNSSQSYVMTKGWSRFVKEKRLEAGDTVSFFRGVGDSARLRLFIESKPRTPPPDRQPQHFMMPPPPPPLWGYNQAALLFRSPTLTIYDHHHHHHNHHHHLSGNLYLRSTAVPGASPLGPVLDSVPLVHNKVVAKRVRLFGVNIDYPETGGEDEAESSTGEVRKDHLHEEELSTTLIPYHHHQRGHQLEVGMKPRLGLPSRKNRASLELDI